MQLSQAGDYRQEKALARHTGEYLSTPESTL